MGKDKEDSSLGFIGIVAVIALLCGLESCKNYREHTEEYNKFKREVIHFMAETNNKVTPKTKLVKKYNHSKKKRRADGRTALSNADLINNYRQLKVDQSTNNGDFNEYLNALDNSPFRERMMEEGSSRDLQALALLELFNNYQMDPSIWNLYGTFGKNKDISSSSELFNWLNSIALANAVPYINEATIAKPDAKWGLSFAEDSVGKNNDTDNAFTIMGNAMALPFTEAYENEDTSGRGKFQERATKFLKNLNTADSIRTLTNIMSTLGYDLNSRDPQERQQASRAMYDIINHMLWANEDLSVDSFIKSMRSLVANPNREEEIAQMQEVWKPYDGYNNQAKAYDWYDEQGNIVEGLDDTGNPIGQTPIEAPVVEDISSDNNNNNNSDDKGNTKYELEAIKENVLQNAQRPNIDPQLQDYSYALKAPLSDEEMYQLGREAGRKMVEASTRKYDISYQDALKANTIK